jgi:hypothetical protein
MITPLKRNNSFVTKKAQTIGKIGYSTYSKDKTFLGLKSGALKKGRRSSLSRTAKESHFVETSQDALFYTTNCALGATAEPKTENS